MVTLQYVHTIVYVVKETMISTATALKIGGEHNTAVYSVQRTAV